MERGWKVGLESDAGRASCDLYSLCGSGDYLLVKLLLFIPDWFWREAGGGRGTGSLPVEFGPR